MAKEKQVTTKQAFPFHACFNEQNFCEAEREALQERFCESDQHKKKENTMQTIISPIPDPVFSYPFFHNTQKTAFFDIETTGLSPKASSLYLIGMMYFNQEEEHWELCQWFADDYQSEPLLLESFFQKLEQYSYLYHFNGQTFDIPYILKKCEKHSITPSDHCMQILSDTASLFSIDLLKKIRPLKKCLGLARCNQTSVEKWLGIQREDTFSGGDLIPVYSEYMQKKILNPQKADSLKELLLLHNHDDIAMMLNVCSLLLYSDLFDPEKYTDILVCKRHSDRDLPIPTTFSDPKNDQNNSNLQKTGYQLEQTDTTVTLTFLLKFSFPKKVSMSVCYPESNVLSLQQQANLLINNDQLSLTIPIITDSLKFFFPNYKEYYYLIKEDMAIHKSVAKFVDPSFRKRATKATCYTHQNGIFIPSLAVQKKSKKEERLNNFSPLFQKEYQDKLAFFRLPEEKESDTFWHSLLLHELPFFAKAECI